MYIKISSFQITQNLVKKVMFQTITFIKYKKL